MTNFYLVRVESPGVEVPLPNYGPYPTGPTAAYWAKDVAKKTGTKVMPRRIAQAPDWRLQQKARFDAGELKPLPSQWDLPPIDGHFIHQSPANEFMVAYFANPAHAVMNKATEAKPGGYLAKFYPAMSENDRKRYAALVDNSGDVFFAMTEDEAEFAYENCPHTSCMTTEYQRSRGRGFSSPIHPIRVYAAGDLAIAYTKSKNGSVAERCLCWPNQKIYSRIYGDGSGRLGKLLMAKGFQSAEIDAFNGARLKRILVKGQFVAPYIDANHGEEPMLRDDGEFLIIDTEDGTMHAQNTTGMITAHVFEPPLQPDPEPDLVESIRLPIQRPVTLPASHLPMLEQHLIDAQMIVDGAITRSRFTTNNDNFYIVGDLAS